MLVKMNRTLLTVKKEAMNTKQKRIEKNWNTVRRIARASMSISLLTDLDQDFNYKRAGIWNFDKFFKVASSDPSSRSEEDINFLVRSTSHLPFFGQRSHMSSFKQTKTSMGGKLTKEQHFELCRTLLLRQIQENEVVFEVDDDANEVFVVVEGSLLSCRSDGFVSSISEGQSFGELALSRRIPTRSTRVTASEPTIFLVIHKDDYQRILRSQFLDAFSDKLEFLRLAPAFKELDERSIFQIATSAQLHRLRPGSKVVKEGEPIDPNRFFFVVKRGEMAVIKAGALVCNMAVREAICDSNALSQRHLTKVYPFTLRCETLVEYYSMSRRDILNRLQPGDLEKIRMNVTNFPDSKLWSKACQMQNAWTEYKNKLVNSIIHSGYQREKLDQIIARPPRKAKLNSNNKRPTLSGRQLVGAQKKVEEVRGADQVANILSDTMRLNRQVNGQTPSIGARFFAKIIE